MADVKTCAKCGKKLRSDNTKGICGQAGPCARRAAAGGVAADAGDDDILERTGGTKPAEAPPKTKSDAMKRFRVVAEAMGYDPEQLLSTYCEGWLAAVKAEVDKIEAPGE